MQSRNPIEVNILIVMIAQGRQLQPGSKKARDYSAVTHQKGGVTRERHRCKAVRAIDTECGVDRSRQAVCPGIILVAEPCRTCLRSGKMSATSGQRTLSGRLFAIHALCGSAAAV